MALLLLFLEFLHLTLVAVGAVLLVVDRLQPEALAVAVRAGLVELQRYPEPLIQAGVEVVLGMEAVVLLVQVAPA